VGVCELDQKGEEPHILAQAGSSSQKCEGGGDRWGKEGMKLHCLRRF
jgi:hypothetical protein